jgi:hypothetical protein
MSTAEAAVLPGTGPKQATRRRLEPEGENLRLAGPERAALQKDDARVRRLASGRR